MSGSSTYPDQSKKAMKSIELTTSASVARSSLPARSIVFLSMLWLLPGLFAPTMVLAQEQSPCEEAYDTAKDEYLRAHFEPASQLLEECRRQSTLSKDDKVRVLALLIKIYNADNQDDKAKSIFEALMEVDCTYQPPQGEPRSFVDLITKLKNETPPAPPIPSSPPDGTTEVSLNPTLAWNTGCETDSFEAEIDTDAQFPSDVKRLPPGNSTSLVISDLDDGVTYYWRVRSRRGSTHSTWSDTWSFSTNRPDSVILDFKDVSELVDSLAQYLKANLPPSQGEVLIAPPTKFDTDKQRDTGRFSELSDYFRVKLTNRLSGFAYSNDVSNCGKISPDDKDIALAYAKACDAGYVWTGIYERRGNRRDSLFWIRASLRKVPSGNEIPSGNEVPLWRGLIRASILYDTGKSLKASCDLKYWNWPCPWPPWYYLTPGWGMMRESSSVPGNVLGVLWVSTTPVATGGLIASLVERANALAKAKSAAFSDDRDFYKKQAEQARQKALAFTAVLVTSYVGNFIWLKLRR